MIEPTPRPTPSRLRTPDGWDLQLTRAVLPSEPAPGPPVLFVPGYGMNSHIFHHHPSGPSFAAVLRSQGFDPWSVDLRGTSSSRPPTRRARVRMADQAFIDLPAVLDHLHRVTGHERVHAIGCSLGGALLYAHTGRDEHQVDRLVTMGSPLVMTADTFPLRALSRLGPVLSRLPVKGSRRLAVAGLPLVAQLAPGALWFYMNPALIDLSRPEVLARTVEDPVPRISHQMSRWARYGSMMLDGYDVTQGLKGLDRPLMVVYAAEDGVCPPRAALTAVDATGGPVTIRKVSHPDGPVRHADLFVARFVPTALFPDVGRFLSEPTP